jgi:DNA polymerase-1
MTEQIHHALDKQYVETYFGRRRRFPFFTKRDHDAIGRQAVNTPIQSAASDICLASLVEISERLDTADVDASILFPVHDSICIECKIEDVPRLERLCRDVMEKDFLGVPLKVDFEYGPTWAQTEVHP